MSSSVSAMLRRLGARLGHPLVWFTFLLLCLACYRFSLIDRGHFYWSDERCYLPAAKLVDAVVGGDYRAATERLFEARGKVPAARPGFVLVSVLPVLGQRLVGTLAGIDPQTPRYYDVASAFNVLVTLGVTCCLFALGRLWTGCAWFGVLIALVHSLLCSANVWIRHMMPYQEALLFSLLALWLLSTTPRPDERAVLRLTIAGLLTAFGYSCYPGHYAFVIINAAVTLARSGRRINSMMVFGLSSATVIGLFELLARFTGSSYLQDLRSLSGSVTMGYPKEGYVFVWHYLRDVEGAVGVVLFVLFSGFVAFLLWRRRVNVSVTARTAICAAIGCYLFHASMGVFFGNLVFYGRVLMVYLPFMVGGAVLALIHIRSRTLRRVCVCSLLIASAYSFVGFASEYSRIVYPAEFLQNTMTGLGRELTYPANVLWGLVDGNQDDTVESFDPMLTTVADSRPDGCDQYVLLASHPAALESDTRFIGVNLKYMWYVRHRYDRFTPPAGYTLVAEALHPEVFPATGYEGRKPWERKRIRQRQYTMRIYERVSNVRNAT
ncbi:MAG: hypothetical protein JSU86_02155 [Phycisphaerales bacterium]|nr:MAG: hypothetical protein JSU86_02155 [Phycisphaerales bacterium]